MSKMVKDKCFVKVLAACETMGGATAICTDKTGTLTENRMTVVEGWFAGRAYDTVPAADALPPAVLQQLATGIALNSRAFLTLKPGGALDFAGSRTECALLVMLRAWQQDYEQQRRQHEGSVVKLYGFSSARKMSSVLLSTKEGCVLYNKVPQSGNQGGDLSVHHRAPPSMWLQPAATWWMRLEWWCP